MLKSTNQRIIRATMELLSEKGYQKTTTKEIATKANVSEATIFRNFKNKRGVIAAIMKMKSTPTKTLEAEFKDDLYTDLKFLGSYFLEDLTSKKEFIYISIREPAMFKDLTDHEKIYPQELRDMLIHYFKKMSAQHRVLEGKEDIYADIFISTYFGFFIQQLEQDIQLVLTQKEDFIETCTHIFMRGISPT
ncbi:TetR/AcrR family transcriptional regulator [Bacillus sp. FSL W7-1034]|uniref:TetR/AcrR family transcriptional regulator n=1 Tax=Bacillus sp. FSL W7-1034 TaxID=2954564 RepID=UPI00315A30E7